MNAAAATPRYVLRLFVAGNGAQSTRAVSRARAFCEAHLHGDYQLTVVDLYQQSELAAAEQIVALPTLLRLMPEPLRRLVGDLSDAARLREALGLDDDSAGPDTC